MYFKIGIILAVMVIAYALAKWRRLSVELSIFTSAIAGGLVGAIFGNPPFNQLARHLVEGSFTYLDVILIFSTATIFMAIVSESGSVNYVVRIIIKYFYNKRIIALLLLMIIILIPGALTGAGSVSLLVVGAPVALALNYLGIPKRKVAAILFIVAGLSAAAPPVNIWAMILCAGTAIPYVGFELPLGIPVLLLGSFTVLLLGWKKEGKMTLKEALKEIPEVPPRMRWWRVLLPFLVFFGLVAMYRIWPFSTPILGLPLEFTISALIAFLISPKKINILILSRDTIKKLLPLLATMVVVGMLQQIMTATGVRGLLSFAVISTPLILLFISLAFIIPVSEGILTYGGAAVIGIPLVWYFDSIGLHATVVMAGLSLLWPLGDGLPPTALIGRLSVMVSEYKESYWTFLKSTWIPWIVITIVGILMVVFSAKLSFLVQWSM
ncbi:C4-dicarboxylate ABC transporter [Candidatus Aminicenantes bacterium AC-335-A11]|jgi:CitMHS family citrate-Mg2+:H+ or citrate-Ca2+:H+ symporter|nr:C4-dicarboxylate ABC transporter [SCandidatus Aminicenantes bacterium Aminicenantia_JdfR_composite]MCP2619138.1 C4-dicarboxylate ABC transporter [Candidatus Aminicenantes bacterium AC-335-A11]